MVVLETFCGFHNCLLISVVDEVCAEAATTLRKSGRVLLFDALAPVSIDAHPI